MLCPICSGILTSSGRCFHGSLQYRKLSEEGKVSAIRAFTGQRVTIAQICSHFGVSAVTVKSARKSLKIQFAPDYGMTADAVAAKLGVV